MASLNENDKAGKKTKKEPKEDNAVSNAFKETIKDYLDNYSKENPMFASKYSNKNKSIDECCNFIINEVKKMGVIGLTDNEVFYLARHYYEEEKIEASKLPSGLKVVVNHHVELSEEEKKKAHEKAVHDFEESERKKLEEKKKKDEEKEKLKKEKKLKQSNDNMQMSLFDLLGE